MAILEGTEIVPKGQRTLAERMRMALPGMSPGERRIVRLFLSISAPEQVATISALADRAKVSSPTVLRCLDKIGFERFSDFRDLAVVELAQKHESALAQMGRSGSDITLDGQVSRFRESLTQSVGGTLERLDIGEFERAVDLLADSQRRQMFTGGRFSQSLAEQLFAHANLMRAGCELVGFSSIGRAGRLVDVGRNYVLTVFDFRRYQRDTVAFAHSAKQRRAKLVLVTDQWMSPIADWADAVLVADVRNVSPFDTLVSAMAIVDTLIGELYRRFGDAATQRLAQFESDNVGFEWDAESQLATSGGPEQ